MGSFRRNRSEFGKDFESSALHQEASSVTFKPYTNSEILQLSACHVFSPNSFNQLGHPIPNGLYDLKMGPFTDRGDLKCATCLLISSMCPGHVGHIELPVRVPNPLHLRELEKISRFICGTCGSKLRGDACSLCNGSAISRLGFDKWQPLNFH